jgi:asparagine synthase (glutamine-hydrolysing)
MCGIAGIVDLKGGRPPRPLLERLCARLVHRGPDEEGYYQGCNAALAQRRLSIIDLSGGRQPLANEDGSVWVTFNGEIYNFHDLRSGLERQGHRFATRSDTEVIVHAYEQYGVECLKQFRGMFAFALWDEKAHALLLARDRVGKKPLFYAEADGQFVFASELQALVQHPAVRRELDPTAIDDYLTYGYIPSPKTPFRGVFKLPPAHYLTLRATPDGSARPDLRVARYWQLEFTPKWDLREEEAAQGLREVLTEAVRLRLIADVPLGALLSGGIDSSLVVALMSRLSGRAVKTFSIGFEEEDFNELPYARQVARRYGTDHHELVVRPRALDILPTLVRHYGEPYADSSAIPSYYVAKLTRQHVKVALNGDGGDECLAGYERYLASTLAERYQRVPWVLRRGVIEPLAALAPEALLLPRRLRQAKRLLQSAARPFAQRYLGWVTYLKPEQKQDLYTPEFRERLAGYEGAAWLRGQLEAPPPAGGNQLDVLLAADVQSYLPDDLLVKMDIASMANSLEARSPFLDHKVMEFCARLPGRYKVRGATLKYLLRRVGRGLLPPANLRRRKMGFGVPVGRWMRRELRPLLEDALFSPRSFLRGYFRAEPLRRIMQGHQDGRQDSSYLLWALLWLELWHRDFTT